MHVERLVSLVHPRDFAKNAVGWAYTCSVRRLVGLEGSQKQRNTLPTVPPFLFSQINVVWCFVLCFWDVKLPLA